MTTGPAPTFHPATAAGATVGTLLALAPGPLPREPLVQAVVLVVFAGVCAGLVRSVAAVAARLYANPIGRPHRALARLFPWAAAGAVAASAGHHLAWQNGLQRAVYQRDLGIDYPLIAFGLPALVVAAIIVVRVARRAVHHVRVAPRAVRPPRRGARAAAAVVVATSIAIAVPGEAAAAGSHATDFLRDAPAAALRIYSPLTDGDRSAEALRARAADVVRRWAAAGGLRRAAVVVMVPTGSGWVDADAVTGFERRFGGDVALLALQYDDLPSWAAYLLHPGAARASARALADAVTARIASGPERPALYVYGQSLGALGAAEALPPAAAHSCRVVLVGPPVGTRPPAGATVVANPTDPVGSWSPELLWRPVDTPPATVPTGADAPRPAWLPVASFLQTTVDVMRSLGYPRGVGHRYGPEQTAPAGCHSIGPRATS